MVYWKYAKVFDISHVFDHEISLKKNGLVISLAKSVGLTGLSLAQNTINLHANCAEFRWHCGFESFCLEKITSVILLI